MDQPLYSSEQPTQSQGPNFSFNSFQWSSLLSWLLLSVTSLVSLVEPSPSDEDSKKNLLTEYAYTTKVFWLSFSSRTGEDTNYIPIMLHYGYLFLCFSILIGLIFVCCCIIIYNLLYDRAYIEGMFQVQSKFHCVPIVCLSALFMIGELLTYTKEKSANPAVFIFSFIFSLIALCSLIFIHIKTDLSYSKVLNLIIKQATYGCLIALLIYNFFFSVWVYGYSIMVYDEDRKYTQEDLTDFFKRCYLIFIILIGVINLGLSALLKNAMITIINIFLYIGMIIWFFKIKVDDRKEKGHGAWEGIIGIIVIVLSVGVLLYLFKMKREAII